MRNIEEIIRAVEDSIASPPAQALRKSVRDGKGEFAMEILRDEGLSDEEAAAFIAHFTPIWRGHDVLLTEIQKDKITSGCRYLVRLGTELLQASAEEINGEVQLYVEKGGQVSVSLIAQVWMATPVTPTVS